MRDWQAELDKRVAFLREQLAVSGTAGLVFGNSGGKDSALAGILCKRACDNTLGVIMPCGSARNYADDAADARALAEAYGIETLTVDLGPVRQTLADALPPEAQNSRAALSNLSPRLRMAALYALANAQNRLVVGTSNRSEAYMGYFTKWGDGAHDVNPLADLTVTEIYAFLAYLGAPPSILAKAPSGGLYDGQTDEAEMGVSYAAIDAFLRGEPVPEEAERVIRRAHAAARHKRQPIPAPSVTGL